MIHVYCDRCKELVQHSEGVAMSMVGQGADDQNFDLCDICASVVLIWITSPFTGDDIGPAQEPVMDKETEARMDGFLRSIMGQQES